MNAAVDFRKRNEKLEFGGLKKTLSLRTSPQTGVAIPRIFRPAKTDPILP